MLNAYAAVICALFWLDGTGIHCHFSSLCRTPLLLREGPLAGSIQRRILQFVCILRLYAVCCWQQPFRTSLHFDVLPDASAQLIYWRLHFVATAATTATSGHRPTNTLIPYCLGSAALSVCPAMQRRPTRTLPLPATACHYHRLPTFLPLPLWCALLLRRISVGGHCTQAFALDARAKPCTARPTAAPITPDRSALHLRFLPYHHYLHRGASSAYIPGGR